MSAVAGYCLSNDVSERVFQIERAGQWTKGKGCETFGPLGPWMVTKDEIKDPQNLNMWLTVNGEVRQKGNTKTMIFGVAHIVWACSQYLHHGARRHHHHRHAAGRGLGMKPSRSSSKTATSCARHRRARRAEAEDRQVRAPDRDHDIRKAKPRAETRGFVANGRSQKRENSGPENL